MSRPKKWSLLWIFIPVIVVGAFILLSIHYLIDPNLYRNIIQKSLTLSLGREVTIGKAKISLWDGVGIAFEDFRVKDRSLAFDLLQSKRLIFKIKILPLFKKEVKWKRIVFEKPTLRLTRDKNGQFNIFDGPLTIEGLRDSQQKMIQILSTIFGGSLILRDGELFFSDETLGESPLITEIRSFNLQLPDLSYHKPFSFHLNGKISHFKKEGYFSIVGTIQDILEEMDLSKGKVEGEVEIKDIEIFHFWPYLKTLLPVKTISGNLDLNAHYQVDFSGAFKTSAKIKFRDVVYDHPQVFSYILSPEWANLDLDVEYDLKDLRVPRIFIQLPEIGVKAKGRIYAIGSKEMGIDAEAQSSPFDLSDGRKFVPYRIITPDVSGPLFRGEGKGPVQILSVKLSGKMSEIEHCDQLQNAHTLSVEMKLDKIRLKLPWNLPPLEGLKGHLLFKDGHLNLKTLEGKIFHSSIDRAHGMFSQLLLIPTLQIHSEGRLDLMDFPSLIKIEGLSSDISHAFSPITSLSGKVEYQISAKGKLKPPLHFQHHGVYHLSKARFSHSQVPFPILIGEGRIDLSNEDFQWSRATVEFGNSSLLTNGSWKRGDKSGPFEMMAKGKVNLKTLFSLSRSPLFLEEIRLKTKGIESLSGTGQFSFKGRRLSIHHPLFYEVELMPKEINLLLKGVSAPLTFKDGSLSFSNLGVTFSKVKIQSKNSFLTMDGSIKEEKVGLSTWGTIDLKYLYSLLPSTLFSDQIRSQMDGIQNITGEAEVNLRWLGRAKEWPTALKEGKIRLKGVSFQHRKIPVPFSHIEGSCLLSPEQIRFEGLKGKLGDSPLTVDGTLSRTRPSFPTAPSVKTGVSEPSVRSKGSFSLQIFSPQLDLDPLFPKRKETTPSASFEKIKDWLSNWDVDVKMEVSGGRYRGFHYQDLKGEMKTVDGKLFFRPFQLKGDGGDLWGEGWIQPSEKGIRFEVKPRFSNMEAKAFLRTLFSKGVEERVMISGRVHISKVELRGEGEDSQKVIESLNGRLMFEMENGMIERFNILAKIFSLLNISQWFKGRFPDLTKRGLPYHKIIANLYVKDGVATTEDFLVDSDAMRITGIGNIDLVKNKIDARIGVHPLGTVDTVLSNIPIAGYILTGDNKAFLSYVYEVKGDLNDPTIQAIPIKSIGEGFLGIIKRLLETPLRPFQKVPSSEEGKE